MEEDVPIILDFLEVFLVYLYFVPAKIAAIQEKAGYFVSVVNRTLGLNRP